MKEQHYELMKFPGPKNSVVNMENEDEHLIALLKATKNINHKSIVMSVKAKFNCSAVIPNAYGTGVTAHFHAVYGKGEENKDYAEATPSASLSMVISDKTKAAEYFEQGKEYYLTFEKAE
jgi:hypothetical protein